MTITAPVCRGMEERIVNIILMIVDQHLARTVQFVLMNSINTNACALQGILEQVVRNFLMTNVS